MKLTSAGLTILLTLASSSLSAGIAHAQYFPLPIGRGSPHGAIDFGIGVMRDMHRYQRAEEARRQRAIRSQQERHRRAALSRTKAGRAQLAREDHAMKKRAAAQGQFIDVLARGLFSTGSKSGSGSRSQADKYQDDWKANCFVPNGPHRC